MIRKTRHYRVSEVVLVVTGEDEVIAAFEKIKQHFPLSLSNEAG